MRAVFEQDPSVRRATSAYIEDILVNENVVKASRVEEHLHNYGLVNVTSAALRWSVRMPESLGEVREPDVEI